ncbi:MAG: methylmalonyl-CoA mutase family protein [Anditalea sp.]
MKDKKFQDFSPVDKQTWIDQAIKDLKGEDFEQRLITKSMEDFSIFPFYTAEDAEAINWVKEYENQVNPPSGIPGMPPRIWANAVKVGGESEEASHEEIRFVLESGADGLIVELSGKEDLDEVFKDVLLQYIQIWIKPVGDPSKGLLAFFEWVDRQSIDHPHLNGGVLWDGLVQGFDQPIQLKEQLDKVLFLHELSKPYPHFKSICLDTATYHNAGATAVQEIGYGMAALVELMDGLTEKGAKPDAVFQDLFLFTAVGSNYFMEIAKLKTFRMAMHQLSSLYQVALKPEDLQIFTRSSVWSKSRMGLSNNLLRNTTEAMSAILGGCNTLFVEPHDKCFKSPDAFSKRMARNISNILKEECYFDKVIDPAAGSYYVENLIHSLQEHSFQLLESLEDEGGWWQAYQKNKIQETIKAVRRKKFDLLANGENLMVGVNQYVDFREEKAYAREDYPEEAYQLKPFSQSFPVERTL